MAAVHRGRRVTLISFLFEVILILYILHDVPVIGWITPAVVYIALTLLLFLLSFLRIGIIPFGEYFLKSLPVSAMYLLVILLQASRGDNQVVRAVFGYLQLLISLIIGLYIIDERQKRLAKHIIVVLALSYLATSITTYIGLLEYPNASRELATGVESDSELFTMYTLMNIGGFSFIYHITLVIPLLIGLFKNRIGNRVVLLIIILGFFLTIIKSQYTTALLCSILSLFLFLAQKDFSHRNSTVFILVSFVIVALGIKILPIAISTVSKSIDSEIVSDRLNELTYMLSGREGTFISNDSDVTERIRNYSKSWESFLNSGGFGTWDFKSIGGHSFFLDYLAIFGLLGLLVFFLMWVMVWIRYIMKNRKARWYGYVFSAFLEALILSIVNPHFDLYFVGFIVPVFIVLFERFDSFEINET